MKKIPREVLEVAGLLWWQYSMISTGRVMGAITGGPMMNRDDSDIANRAEQLGYLSRETGKNGQWVWAFSAEMQKRMIGEINPQEYWSGPWTGQWSLVTFDIPRNKSKARNQLHYVLKKLRFGCLQGSVWISPRPTTDINKALQNIDVASSEICIFTAQQSGKDRSLVEIAWRWKRIREAYQEYKKNLDHLLRLFDEGKIEAKVLVAEDSLAWTRVIQKDPLLPEALWPHDYPGFEHWTYRAKEIRKRIKMKTSLK